MFLINLKFLLIFWLQVVFVKSARNVPDLCNGHAELLEKIEITRLVALQIDTLHYQISIGNKFLNLETFFNDSRLPSTVARFSDLQKPVITRDTESTEIAIMYNQVNTQYLYLERGNEDKVITTHPSAAKKSTYTVSYCHYNFFYKVRVCFEFIGTSLNVYEFTDTTQGRSRPVKPIELAKYIQVDLTKSTSFVNEDHEDVLVFFHQYNWIYELNLKQHNAKTFALRTYQLLVPPGWNFKRFLYADETGMITEYEFAKDPSLLRQYYSIKTERSGLHSYCLHEGEMKGTIAIFANLLEAPPQKSYTAALTSLQESLKSYGKLTTSIFILYVCATIYFLIFICYQMVPAKKRFITHELLSMEREVTRLSPVIEPVVISVHEFMNGELLKEGLKAKKDN